MKTHELRNAEGQLIGFEVSNLLLSRRAILRIVRRIPGVEVLASPAPLFGRGLRDDVFCVWRLGNRRFVALEPWGDNSRYWIGPEPAEPCPELETILHAFRGAGPLGWRLRERDSPPAGTGAGLA
jgi:hypothetical protein